jgi:TolB-like protein/DNA-binding winged helix-turn-helix (wHTH) protein/Tfp pilus assembly protein PilF
MSDTQRLKVGEWIVEPSLDSISRAGRVEKLEPRTMSLLMHLVRHAGEVVSSEELLAAVWAGLVVTQDSVYRGIAQLRRHFDDQGEVSAYIATIPRKGYRLIAPVEWLSETAPTPTVAARRSAMPLWLRSALVLVVIAAGVGYWLVPRDWFARASGHAPVIQSIAVLPFADRSPGGNNTAFCEGLADELNDAISHLPLQVVARSSTRTLRDTNADPRTIGQSLHVTHLLEGSVRRDGDRLRVTAELIDSRSGFGVWSQTFDRSARDVLDVQEDIARAVAEQLALSLSAETDAKLASRPTANVDAYEQYLLGRYERAQNAPAANTLAIEHFQRAIALDPRFAPAYAGLADADIASYYLANEDLATITAQVEPLLAKALEIDSLSADAYAARGWLRSEQGRLAESETDLRRALTLNPNLAPAYVRLAVALEYDGRPRDALDSLRQAARIDPLNGGLHVRWCLVLQNLGLFEEAEPECVRARELGPANSNATWATALLHWAQGDDDGALRWFRLALTQAPKRVDLLEQQTTLLLDLGRIDDASKALAAFSSAGAAMAPQIALSRADVLLAREDFKELRRELAASAKPASLDTEGDLRAAALALESGDRALARQFADQAIRSPGFNRTRLMNVWHTRWARSDALTLALVGRSGPDAAGSAQLLTDLGKYLDRLQSNGHVWGGIHYLRACVLAQQGDVQGARAALLKAQALGWHRAWWAKHDPALAPLAADPAFRALMQGGFSDTSPPPPATQHTQTDGSKLHG